MTSLAARWQFSILDTSGVEQAVFDNYQSVNVSRTVNDIDTLKIVFYDDLDSRFSYFLTDYIIIGIRSVPGLINKYNEFVGLIRSVDYSLNSDGTRIIEVTAFGLNQILARRIIAYDAGTIRAEKNAFAETAMKEYVAENCGPNAGLGGVVGRLADGNIPGFYVEEDNGEGITWSGSREYDNLLDVLQDIAEFAHMDFNVEYLGSANFVFRTYSDYGYGINRTDEGVAGSGDNISNIYGNVPLIFSAELGNVSKISRGFDRTSEANVVIVLGQGDISTRKSVTVEDTNTTDDSPFNRMEISRSGSSNEYEYQLEAFGWEELEKNHYNEGFQFTPMRQETCMYGLHFCLGDRVVVVDRDVKAYVRINSVNISVSGNEESISIGVDKGVIVNG